MLAATETATDESDQRVEHAPQRLDSELIGEGLFGRPVAR